MASISVLVEPSLHRLRPYSATSSNTWQTMQGSSLGKRPAAAPTVAKQYAGTQSQIKLPKLASLSAWQAQHEGLGRRSAKNEPASAWQTCMQNLPRLSCQRANRLLPTATKVGVTPIKDFGFAGNCRRYPLPVPVDGIPIPSVAVARYTYLRKSISLQRYPSIH
jgi:hypothetical protein